MNFDLDYFKKVANIIFNTPSPTGYTYLAINKVKELVEEIGY